MTLDITYTFASLKKLPNIARDEIRIMDFQINAAAYGFGGEGCNSTRLKNLTNEV